MFTENRPRGKRIRPDVQRGGAQQKPRTVRTVGGRPTEDRDSALDELEELRRFKAWAQAHAAGMCQQLEAETGAGGAREG